jgi:amino acid transporter
MTWQRLEPEQFVRPIAIVSGAMIVFFNCEGFELIANASGQVKDRRRSLPVAYIGGVSLVILFYVLIAMVTVGHLSFAETAGAGELPQEFEHEIRGLPLEGMFVFAVVALILANFVPLGAIATMASAGFLLIFMVVNIVNVRLAKETRSQRWISTLGTLACGAALVTMCVQIDENPHSRRQLWILLGMVAISLLVEVVYRAWSGRSIHLVRRRT